MVAPQAGQLGRVGEDHVGLIVGQHELGPQLALGDVQQGGLGQLAVDLPPLFQLGKQLIVGLLGLDQLHQTGLSLIDEFLVGYHNAQGVANVEKDCLDIGSHVIVLLKNI